MFCGTGAGPVVRRRCGSKSPRPFYLFCIFWVPVLSRRERRYLLLVPLARHVALLDVPVAHEVAQVPEDGEDAVAHVGEHGHQQRRLLERFHEGLVVQAGVSHHIVVLGGGWGGKRKRKREILKLKLQHLLPLVNVSRLLLIYSVQLGRLPVIVFIVRVQGIL